MNISQIPFYFDLGRTFSVNNVSSYKNGFFHFVDVLVLRKNIPRFYGSFLLLYAFMV